jgi:hypothetical protein
MNNKVIYTSIVGNYDILKDPPITLKGWDYICFSNDLKQQNYSVWRIRPIPFKFRDNLRLSRYVKLNPHRVLDNYKYSLWIDSNLTIINHSIENILNEFIKDDIMISVPKHPFRICAYDEAMTCIREGRDKKQIIEKQIEFLKNEGFPYENGLFENNIIFRQHNNSQVIQQSNDWWKNYIQFSKRDQLSFPYTLWKNKLTCVPFMLDNFSARNHPGIQYSPHNRSIKNRIKTSLQIRLNKYFSL